MIAPDPTAGEHRRASNGPDALDTCTGCDWESWDTAPSFADHPGAGDPKNSEGVGTGAGDGATGQVTGAAWVNRSTDCPEAPAQAHPLGPDGFTGLAGDVAYDRLHGVDGHTQAAPPPAVAASTGTSEDGELAAWLRDWSLSGCEHRLAMADGRACSPCLRDRILASDWLAAHDAATADRVRRETLREAAHWFGVIWGTGLTTEAQVADVLNRWAEHGIGSRGDE